MHLLIPDSLAFDPVNRSDLAHEDRSIAHTVYRLSVNGVITEVTARFSGSGEWVLRYHVQSVANTKYPIFLACAFYYYYFQIKVTCLNRTRPPPICSSLRKKRKKKKGMTLARTAYGYTDTAPRGWKSPRWTDGRTDGRMGTAVRM